MYRYLLLSVLLLGVLGPTKVAEPNLRTDDLKRVAHAGGGIHESTYTNSIDALEANADRFDLFEIDFSFTSDGALVCIHDWRDNAASIFGGELITPPTLAEFERLVLGRATYKNCTLNSLVEWLKNNPQKRIVTDVKDNNIKALTLIAKTHTSMLHQFIPQIYAPEEYNAVRELGFHDVIWTLYRYGRDPDTVVRKARDMQLYAVTMPIDRAESGIGRLLHRQLGIRSYVHTINTVNELDYVRSLGIRDIYTDWLSEPR